MGDPLLIYSAQPTARLRYTLDLIFRQLLLCNYELIQDISSFNSFSGPKVSYGRNPLGDELFIYSMDLLFEIEIKKQHLTIDDRNGIKILFRHYENSALPFDPLVATFYLVSRYEEYLPFLPDVHGRFPAEASLNYKIDFHEVPVVNHYALFIKEIIQQRFPAFPFPEKKFRTKLTYDIDQAWCYRNKGFLRNAGGYLRSFLQLKWSEILERAAMISGNKPDLYFTFEEQKKLHEQYRLAPLYFFLVGDRNQFDKNISWNNPAMQQLIRDIAANNEIGLHAGYATNANNHQLTEEKNRLENITGKKVFRNRQHFLKFRFPETYRRLIAAGFTEDYSMGYSSQAGFRAGIAEPFYFFDLQKNESTNLLIYPFAAMDAALHYYMKMTPDAALEKTIQLLNAVKKVNGLFILLAHNDLISEDGPWKGWKEKFPQVLKEMSL